MDPWGLYSLYCNFFVLCCIERELTAISPSLPFLLYTIPLFFLQEHMTSGANCQTFTSSTVISYSNLGDGPKVYQETSEMRSAPGGVRRRLQCIFPAQGCWFCCGWIDFVWWLSAGHPQHFCLQSVAVRGARCDSLNHAEGHWEGMGSAGRGKSIFPSSLCCV